MKLQPQPTSAAPERRPLLHIRCSLLALACLSFFLTSGCKDSRRAHQPRETNGAETVEASAPATPPVPPNPASKPIPAGALHPVSLDAFYQRQFADYRPTDSWAQVPRGETNFDGVPFLMFGKIDLTGLGRARDGEFQPARVGDIPVGHRAARVHLIHGASYDAPDDTPIASVLLRYENGETRHLFIRYGVHARNWYVEANEVVAELSDPRSLVVWNGNTRPDGAGRPTRLFKTTFDNPLPALEVRSIDLLSLFARANSVILAITLEEASAAAAQGVSNERNDDSEYRREDLVRALDADTGQPVPGVMLKLSVTERARTYRFGTYLSDGGGQIRIHYPPGRFQTFLMELASPDYVPVKIEVSSDDGLFGPDMPVRLKRQSAP
jgi:hypothetical protein